MKLFGGSENYILSEFEVSVNASKSIPKFRILLNKIHRVSDVPQSVLNAKIDDELTAKVFRTLKMAVQDNYKVEGDTVELYLNSVGRFVIESSAFNKNMFALFKKIVSGERYFSLDLSVSVNGWTTGGQDTAKIKAFQCAFTADEQTASFGIQ